MSGEAPDAEGPQFRFYSAKVPCCMAVAYFILNRFMGFFWDGFTCGFLNWLTFWTPLLEQGRMVSLSQTMRIQGRQLTFSCPACDFFCAYYKLSLLNFVTFTLYGRCCGGNEKYEDFLNSHLTWKDDPESAKGKIKYFGADVFFLWKFVYIFGNLLSLGIAYPFLKLWMKKKKLKLMNFDGITLSLENASYCTYAKKWLCCNQANEYLDEVMVVKSEGFMKKMIVGAKQKAEGAAGK